MPMTRRRFGSVAIGAFASFALGGACRTTESAPRDEARLTARPRENIKTTATATSTLGLNRDRDATLRLPATSADGPLPLLVLLHGAGGTGEGVIRRVGPAADETGVAILAPDSRDGTWDAIRGSFGRDVRFLDQALQRVFEIVSIDATRVAVGGFSDGATYALSVGLANGDLFRRIVAFSPGFIVDAPRQGTPKVFVSHGTADPILPIDQTSLIIVPTLRRRGYDVTFREFDGRHEVPPAIASEGLRWMVAA